MTVAEAIAQLSDVPPFIQSEATVQDVTSQVEAADAAPGTKVIASLAKEGGGQIFLDRLLDGGYLVGAVVTCETPSGQ
ncbi:MAG: hypothetical protein HY240_03540 [Actinobacteria bacterium]|nr:hypothetical protein [Actinomycetota bacterium]